MSERHEMKTESTYAYRPPTFDEGTVSHGQVHTLPRIQEPTQQKRYAPPTFSDEARYALTLLEDGTLLLQTYWEMDGIPMVSTGWYERIG